MDKKQNSEKKKSTDSTKKDIQSKGTDFIHSIIHEYLVKKEYYKTLDIFQVDLFYFNQDEIGIKIKNNTFLSSVKHDENLGENILFQLLNGGKKNDFFKLWNRLIPNHIKLREDQLQKFEFFVQIYFAVYPLLPNIIGDVKVNKNI